MKLYIEMYNPSEINHEVMLFVAIIGLIVNIILTYILYKSLKKEENLNIKSAFWHFLGDLINSVGVILTALILKFTNLVILDAIISIVISLIIFYGAIKIIKESVYILMEATPKNLDVNKIHEEILKIKNIKEIHEFHLWQISSTQYIISFHVILKKYKHINDYKIVKEITKMLKDKFNISHVTIQIENLEINGHDEYED